MIFSTTMTKYIFILSLISCLVIEICIFITSSKNKKNFIDKKDKEYSMQIILVASIGLVIINPLISVYVNLFLPRFVFWIGILIVYLGCIFRVSSLVLLKKYFSVDLKINSEKKLCKKGIYRTIRHPAYLGSILMLVGNSISYRNIVGIVVTIVISNIIFRYRIKIEEDRLVNEFGEEYLEYKENTGALIPYIR